ncbi:hypothetical protein GCM10011578_009480 [Streptomyces fuscichromogenes]|uniref:Uncharacterized protein n=1 Tax=Streptomyces fuscichromogenes TaxID=1324013 RepID=A0A917X7S6_9ACTN|nr:hypothetical protein GCM10011578_009480 [Streptomyces fuscichromogenes]
MAQAQQVQQAEQTRPSGGESTGTVIVAALANLGIALAKAVAGVISGSSAMPTRRTRWAVEHLPSAPPFRVEL